MAEKRTIQFQATIDDGSVVVALDPIDVEILLEAMRISKIALGAARRLGVATETLGIDAREAKLVALLTKALGS